MKRPDIEYDSLVCLSWAGAKATELTDLLKRLPRRFWVVNC